MRKPIIVGNWKMNKLNSEAKAFFEAVESYLDGNEAATYGIGAPFTCVGTCVANKKTHGRCRRKLPFQGQWCIHW